ncbi:hypothetical protein [Streptomyces sp. 2A115]
MDDVTFEEFSLKIAELSPDRQDLQLNPNGPEVILGEEAEQYWDIVVD